MNKKGFTLLEVLIAVFILTLMSMMIWQITNNSYRGSQKAAKYDVIYQYARTSIDKLSKDLSMAFMVGPVFQGKSSDGSMAVETSFVGEDQGENDAVNFYSFSGTRLIKNEKKSDQLEIGYSVKACPNVDEKLECLMRRESSVIDTNPKEGGTSNPVAKGIKRFNLEYYEPSRQEWRPDWNSKDPGLLNKLPIAVRFTLAFDDPMDETNELVFTSSVMVPLSGGPIDF